MTFQDTCTDECQFRYEHVNGCFRYSSLVHRGHVPVDPKRKRKKWYIGMKRGQVMLGHVTRKKQQEVQLLQKPVLDTSAANAGYHTATQPTVIESVAGGGYGGEADRSGGVSVVTSPTTRPRRNRRLCPSSDPLNLFRRGNCDNSRRKETLPAKPFSRHSVRHGKNKRRKSRGRSGLNLFEVNRRRDDSHADDER